MSCAAVGYTCCLLHMCDTCLCVSGWLSGTFTKLWKATISFVTSVHSVWQSEWNYTAPTGWIFMKFDIWVFFENLLREFMFYWNLTRITGTLYEDQYTFLIISHYVLLEWEMFQTEIVDKIKTHIVMFSNFFSPSKNCAICVIMWKNIVRAGHITDDNTAHVHCMQDT
jgi:hypothetical protein